MWAACKQQGDADKRQGQYKDAAQTASPQKLFCSGSFGFQTHSLLYLVMENALQSLTCSTRNTPVTPVCRWQHLFVSHRAFPTEMLWEDNSTQTTLFTLV